MEQVEGGRVSTRRGWFAVAAVTAIALALRTVHLYQIRSSPFFYHPIVDAWDYHLDALRILRSGDWIGHRAFFQAPLTTYFLAAIYRIAGVDVLWPRVANVILGSLTAGGVFLLARRLFGGRAAWIAGLVFAGYPLLIFFEGQLLAPALTMFLDVAFFLLLFGASSRTGAWRYLAAGLVLGLRALATTNILAVVPVFWVWIFLRGRASGRSAGKAAAAVAVFTAGIVLTVAPVTIRNLMVQHDFVLISSNAGLNYYLGNSGDYDARVGIRPGADFDDLIESHVRAGRRVGPEMSGYFFEQARRWAAESPAAFARLQLHKAALFLRGDEIMRNQEIYPFRNYSVVLRLLLWKVRLPGGPGLAFPFGLLLPLAWPGFLLALRRRNAEALLLAAYAVGYSLSVIAFFVSARYRLPVVLPMSLLLAYGFSEVRGWWSPVGTRAAALVGMALLLVLANWNLQRMPEQMNPDAYYSLAGTLAAQGDLEAAETYYNKTIQLNPQNAAAWLNLGLRVYQEERMFARAESCYVRAIELRPDYARAYYNLGYLADITGRPARAESLYLEALRFNPLMDAPYVNIAALALSRGNLERAHDYYLKANEVNPENTKALVGLGVTTFQMEGFDPAIGFFNRAIEIDPGFPDTYFNLALVFARLGRHTEAANYARWTLKLDPLDDQAYRIYASQMLAAGRREEALRFLETAIREHPELRGPRQALDSLAP